MAQAAAQIAIPDVGVPLNHLSARDAVLNAPLGPAGSSRVR